MDNKEKVLQRKRKRNTSEFLQPIQDLPPRRSKRIRYTETITETPSSTKHNKHNRQSSGSKIIKGGGRGLNCSWSLEEDSLLIKAVKNNKGKNWKKISDGICTKSPTQCLHRWQKVLDPSLIKGPWTEGEDKRLIELVETLGAEKWSYISSFLPGRIGKQCRERWFNHLNPKVKKANWLKEEEWILYILHGHMGNHWSKLTSYLPGRTDNTIKNHWNSTMKKRINELTIEYEAMIYGKTDDEIKKLEDDLIDSCRKTITAENEKFYDTKMKNYEMFKNTNVNTPSIKKLKKILNLRTHSKKVKKRGRKRKNKLLLTESKKSVIEVTPIKQGKRNKRSIANVNSMKLSEECSNSNSNSNNNQNYDSYDNDNEENDRKYLSKEQSAFPTTNERTFSNNKPRGFMMMSSNGKRKQAYIGTAGILGRNGNNDDEMNTINHINYANGDNDDLFGIKKNMFFNANENATPNKKLGFFSNSNTFKKAYNYNRLNTSNGKFDMNLFNTNTKGYDFSSTKSFNTPLCVGRYGNNGFPESGNKYSNANLEKMFFSAISVENDSPKKNTKGII